MTEYFYTMIRFHLLFGRFVIPHFPTPVTFRSVWYQVRKKLFLHCQDLDRNKTAPRLNLPFTTAFRLSSHQ